jgi:hypothetical protein
MGPARLFRLGEEPPDDYRALTPEKRLEMLEVLSARMRELTGSRVEAPEPGNSHWAEFLHRLLERQARFLVVGAHALAVHGVPRATQDLDVWIDRDPRNVRAVVAALADFGAPLEDLKISHRNLETQNVVAQIGVAPNRIDLLTSLSGIPDFDAAWADRVEQPIRNQAIPFLGRQHLLDTKRATGRTKDLADLEALTYFSKGAGNA